MQDIDLTKYEDGSWAIFDVMNKLPPQELKDLCETWGAELLYTQINVHHFGERSREYPHTYLAVPAEVSKEFRQTAEVVSQDLEIAIVHDVSALTDVINSHPVSNDFVM